VFKKTKKKLRGGGEMEKSVIKNKERCKEGKGVGVEQVQKRGKTPGKQG